MSKLLNYESLVHATAGATGSVVALICLYPIDNIKLRIQADDKELLDKTTLQALLYLIKNEGADSLYRGIKPVIKATTISNFVYFYTFYGLRTLLPTHTKVTAKIDLILSTIAGIVNVLLTTPLHVVNSRLKLPQDVYAYSGLLDGMVHITKTEGIHALWNGLGPSLLLVSNPVIHLTVYESLKRKMSIKSATAFFFLGALSKSIATVVTYPLQLIQTRQRLAKNKANMTRVLLSILVSNGATGLYQGLESKMVQTVLTAALMFMTYEKIAQTIFRLMLRGNKSK